MLAKESNNTPEHVNSYLKENTARGYPLCQDCAIQKGMKVVRRIIRVEKVTLIGPFSLELHFSDGAIRRINLRDELSGAVFRPLRKPEYFSQVKLDPVAGTIVWPNGADFAPDFLRDLPEEMPQTARKRSADSAVQRPRRSAPRR